MTYIARPYTVFTYNKDFNGMRYFRVKAIVPNFVTTQFCMEVGLAVGAATQAGLFNVDPNQN